MVSLWVSCVVLCACSSGLFVPWDPGEVGAGTEGDLDVTDPDQLVSACFEVEDTAGGVLQVNDWVEQPHDRQLLLLQLQGEIGVSGDATPLDAGALGSVGYWEPVRIAGAPPTGEKSIVLQTEPAQSFVTHVETGERAMMCSVREFENVTVHEGASLRAKAWNGIKGGILAIRVRGTLRVDGTITADGAGYRGGLLRPNDGTSQTGELEDLDTDNNGLGGGKGEGLHGLSYDRSGRGNLANAGGGGNVHNAGGGGGALGGAGGYGGIQYSGSNNTYDNPNTRGMPGAPLADTTRLVFGGGGGAGQQNDSVGGPGGAGGGLLFIVAERLEGSGLITANGADGVDAGNNPVSDYPDGAGGGGSGGLIRVLTFDNAFDGTITAIGGNGGDTGDQTPNPKGPGGGGGGGIVILDGIDPAQVTVDVSGGDNGTFTGTAGTTPWGSSPGEDGVVVTP